MGISIQYVKSAGAALVAAFVLLFTGAAQAQNLSVSDVTQAETNAGTTTFTFIVSLDAPAGVGGVTFDIATADNTATTADNDYVSLSLTSQTIPQGDDEYQFNVTVNGDFTPEPNETFFVNVTGVSGATVADGQGVGTINNDDVALTPIHDIQGPGNSSPIVGASVTTRGVVTGVTSNGFWIQEDDATVDADPATSEGIFVFTSGAPPVAAAFSARVEVTGTVAEFVPSADPLQPPLTELTSPSVTQLLPPGQPLPTAIPLTSTFPDPAGPYDQLERLEGMRVSVASLTVTGPSAGNVSAVNASSTSTGLFHAVITGVARPFREAGIQAPDPPPVGSGTIPPIPRWDSNPERIAVDSDRLGEPIIDVKSGDVVAPLTGPLDYSLRSYTILPDGTTSPVVTPGALPTTVTAATGSEVTVASINLRSFFDDVSDPSTDDTVLTAPAYDRRLGKASLAIRTHLLNPDIIGVQEMENLTTLQALAARITTDGGPSYQAYLVDGNDIAGLDVGFLVKTDLVTGGVPRVAVDSVVQINDGELFVNPDASTAILNDRPPLVLEATVNRSSTQSFPIVVVVTDLRNDSGIDDMTAGPNGWATGGDRVRAKRQKQAESLANYIQSRQTSNPAEHLVVLGSFNAFEVNDGHADVMNVIGGTPPPDNQTAVPGDGVDLVNPDLVNLFSTPPAAERYSDVLLGTARNVDHVLLNAPLVADTSARRIEHPRIGADYPETAMNNGADALRFSDRDPVVAYFTVDSFNVADVEVTKVDTPDPVVAGTTLTYTITVTNNGPDPADAVELSDTLPAGTVFAGLNSPGGWSCITPAVGTPSGAISCSNASMSVGSAVFTLTASVSPSVAAGTVLSNTATVSSTTDDANSGNNSAASTTTVSTSADLSTLVADAPDPVAAGQNVTYNVTVANSGPSDASTVTLTNPVAGNATFVSASVAFGSGWSISAPAVGAAGNVVFSKASVASAENAIFEIVVKIDESTPGGTLHMNTATVASATPDPMPATNSIQVTTTVNGRPTISDITDQTIDEDLSTTPLPFTIGDVETPAANLTVTASSSDPALVLNTHIVLGGTGANRTIMVTPPAQYNGASIITVTVTDGIGLMTSDTFTLTVNAINDDPTITAIADQNSNANTTVGPLGFTVDDIDNDVAGLTLSATSSNQALVANAGITFGGNGANRTVTITPLADQGGQTTITVTVSDGAASASESFVLTVEPPQTPTSRTYLLAEGATGTFFDEDLMIANPNTAAAPVTVRFFREGLTNITETHTIPARSSITLHVDTLQGLEATSAAVEVTSEDGLPLAVERTQFWGDGLYGGHTENAVPAAATRWHFAEGSQGWFDTFVLIGNPQTNPVDVTLTFLRENDVPVTMTVQLGPVSRKTISAATIPDLVNRSFGIIVDAVQPVVAERAMYFGTTATRPWSGGGAAAGATTPSTDWYFAEGATGTFFDTFILLMNPDATNDAHVTVRYLLDSGETVEVPKVVPANGRLTVNIETESDPRLHAASMSARLTSDRPIVAERSVYWPTGEGAQPWGESHVTQGVTAAGSRWALAEGRTGGPLNFHTYILLANPGAQAADVTVEFVPQTGSPVVKTYNVAAGSRFTVDATFEAPSIQDDAFMTLISTAGAVPIVVERSLYWDGLGLMWSGGSSAVATRLPEPPQ